MLISSPAPRNYEAYPVSPSAFQWIEWPLFKLQNQFFLALNDGLNNINKHTYIIILSAKLAREYFRRQKYPKVDTHLKNLFIHTVELLRPFAKCTLIIYCGIAFIPIVLCLAPITLLIDLTTGAKEVHHAYRECYPKEHIDLIFKKKWIASPAQHCTFFLINALFFHLSKTLVKLITRRNPHVWTVLFIPPIYALALVQVILSPFFFKTDSEKQIKLLTRSLLCIPVYRFSVLLTVNYLPQWTRPDRFLIFIDKPFRPIDSIWIDIDMDDRKDYEVNIRMDDWENYEVKTREKLVLRDDTTNFGKFLNRFKNGTSPAELLGLPQMYTKKELKNAFNNWSILLHPDKAKDPDANILFNALCKAYELLKTTS
jgi:hypothetical protein